MGTLGMRCALAALACGVAPAWAQTTAFVNVSSNSDAANSSTDHPDVSADGRFVVFASLANNLVDGDTNGLRDIFLRDTQLGTTARINVGPGGAEANAHSYIPRISADGAFVTFYSAATNLVDEDTNNRVDVFVYEVGTGGLTRESVDAFGNQSNGNSLEPVLSSDGRYLAFASFASNLVGGDTNNEIDVFVKDRQTGAISMVSVSDAGDAGIGASGSPSISADGRYVAFLSSAANLVAGDMNQAADAFVRDRVAGSTTRVSVKTGGAQTQGHVTEVAICADGSAVAFCASASDVVANDTNEASDVFVRDFASGKTRRVSISSAGGQGNSSSLEISMSHDGRYVSFESNSSTLVSGDTNGESDVFVYDRETATTTRLSVTELGAQLSDATGSAVLGESMDFVVFLSDASNLVTGDANGIADLFLRAAPVIDNQDAPPVPNSIGIGIRKGRLYEDGADSNSKDWVRISGTYNFNSHSDNGAFDPLVEDATIFVGDPADPLEISIPAGDPGWKIAASGKQTWRSPNGESPAIRLVLMPKKRAFELDLRKVDFPSVFEGPNVTLIFSLGDESGVHEMPWIALAKPGLFRLP